MADGFFTGAVAAVAPQLGGEVEGRGGVVVGPMAEGGAMAGEEAEAGVAAGSIGTPGRGAYGLFGTPGIGA